MSAAHTPGRGRNWIASTGPHGYGAHDGVTVTDNRGLVVAVAIGDVPEFDAIKTARLIAAAPDMLALVERVAALNPDAGEIGAGMLVQLVTEARAAKAKATGQ